MRTPSLLTWAAGVPSVPGVPVQVTKRQPPGPGEIVAVLDALELPDALPDVRAAHERVREIRAERRDAAESVTGGRAGVQTKLTAGDLTLTQAVDALDRLSRLGDPKGPAAMLADRAISDLVNRSRRALLDAGDEIVAELRPAADRIVARSVELAGSLPESVVGEREALGAGGKAGEAWLELGRLHGQWETLHGLADGLRTAGVLTHADGDLEAFDYTGVPAREREFTPDVTRLRGQFLPGEYRWAEPTRRGTGPVPDELVLARGHAEGRSPGIYTAEQVRAHRAERARRAERVSA